MTSREKIRKIWEEIKELQMMRSGKMIPGALGQVAFEKRMAELEAKYESIEIEFGHSDSLIKSVVYYLDKKQANLEKERNKIKSDLLKIADNTECEDLRLAVENYFSNQ